MTALTLVDVGARGGIDKRWKPFYSELRVVAFEPDPVECGRLNKQSWPYDIRFLPNALGVQDGTSATLHITKRPGCSSLLKPNYDLCNQFEFGSNMEIVGQYPMTLSRLDSVCDVQPDMLKVDTQGTELDILQGAGRLLDRVMAVELEVEFVPQYEGQALFADIDAIMRSKGFMLRGLRRTSWRQRAPSPHAYGGQLMHGDVLYLRHELLDCRAGHLILAAYRQYDLLAKFGATDLIPARPAITSLASKLLSGWSNRELRRTVDRLRPPTASDWHDPDFF
jgi:FkbM family methyltransferase